MMPRPGAFAFPRCIRKCPALHAAAGKMLAFRAASGFLKRQRLPHMLELFHKGGPIMWPLLILSVVALTVVLERILFIARERARRSAADVDEMLTQVERGDLDTAANTGISSRDFVARALAYALTHRERSFSEAMLRAAKLGAEAFQPRPDDPHGANEELRVFIRGGIVMLRLTVDGSGRPTAVSIAKSSGYPRLDRAATGAGRRCRVRDAAPGSHLDAPVRFNLRD